MKKIDIKNHNCNLPLKNGVIPDLEKYAIIQTGGKQYFAVIGKNIVVEKIDASEGSEVFFKEVLFVKNDSNYELGFPFVENKQVVGKLIKQVRGNKVIVFKFKRRKKYRKKQGHRQSHSVIKIMEI